MNLQSIYKKHPYQIYIIAMWIIGFCIIYPIGEFPINDDWAYAKNVHNLVVNKKFVVDQWPAMNLISQTIYGSIVTSIVGFSFTALRLSILILSLSASLYFFNVVLKLSNKNEFVAFLYTATLSFNAICFCLSMTYMTDMFFLSMLIFAMNALVNYTNTGKVKHYFFFALFCIIATLNRQQGMLFALLIAGAVIQLEKGMVKKAIMALSPTFLCWLASDKYRHHLVANHIGHNIQQTSDLSAYLKDAPIAKHLLQAADGLLVTGWLTLPISLFLIILAIKHFQIKDTLILVLVTAITFVISFKAFGIYPLGNISLLLEVGPKVVKSNTPILTKSTTELIRNLNYFASLISISLAICLLVRKTKEYSSLTPSTLSKFIFISTITIYFVFIAISNAYFDRYLLPLFLLLLLFLIPQNIVVNDRVKLVSSISILLIYIFSVTETLDFFNWQKCRWKAITNLQQKGIPNNEIDGGFEFNGWVKTNTPYPNDTIRSWWWVDKDSFIVAAGRIDGIKVDSSYTYQRYLPYYTDTIFVLSRK